MILAVDVFTRAESTQKAVSPGKYGPVFFLFLEITKMMAIFAV